MGHNDGEKSILYAQMVVITETLSAGKANQYLGNMSTQVKKEHYSVGDRRNPV